METKVKSLRARAYFRFFLIGSNAGVALLVIEDLSSECVCEPSIPFPYRGEVKSSIPREHCHAVTLLFSYRASRARALARLLFYPGAFFSRPASRTGGKTDEKQIRRLVG